MAAFSHIRLVVHPARRAPGHTDWPGTPALPIPAVSSIVAIANQHRPSGITWIAGGEPTLRSDLPELIEALAQDGHTVGMDSDGLALVRPGTLAGLRSAGLSWLRLPLHSIVPAAHDWIEGTVGAAKRVRRAAAAARSADISLAGNVLVTRSTVPHLVDTVRLLSAVGARMVHLRRPRCRGIAGEVFVTVSPRLGLSEPYLEAAAARGRDAGVRVRFDGFPACGVPRVRQATLIDDRDPYIIPEPLVDGLGSLTAESSVLGCPRCPGAPACAGAPKAYVERFGRLELDDPGISTTERARPQPPVFGDAPPAPPVREGRSPSTRIRFAIRQSSIPDLGGDPTAGSARNPSRTLQMGLAGPTRSLRVQMVRLAQESQSPLRIEAGTDLLRPEAHGLLREALRLGFAQITVVGDVTALGKRSRRSLARLRGIHGFETHLWHPNAVAHDSLQGPGHHAQTLRALAHLASATGAHTAAVGRLSAHPAPDGLHAWAGAWSADGLPGTPSFCFHRPPDFAAWEALLPTCPPLLESALRSALESERTAQ